MNKKLIKAIADSNLSFDDVAGILGMQISSLYHIVAGRSLSTEKERVRLAEILGCKVKDLF